MARTFDRLLSLECYAYGRWVRTASPVWRRLAVACNRAVKSHPEYRGVR